MSARGLFDRERAVYWPTEYVDLVNLLKGLGPGGKPSHAPFYKFNTGVITLAAVVGLVHSRERDVGTAKQEISTGTFASHSVGNVSLDAFIFLVPLLGGGGVEQLKAGREEEVIRKFERYAAGGLEVLHGALSVSSDSTGMATMIAELGRAARTASASVTSRGNL